MLRATRFGFFAGNLMIGLAMMASVAAGGSLLAAEPAPADGKAAAKPVADKGVADKVAGDKASADKVAADKAAEPGKPHSEPVVAPDQAADPCPGDCPECAGKKKADGKPCAGDCDDCPDKGKGGPGHEKAGHRVPFAHRGHGAAHPGPGAGPCEGQVEDDEGPCCEGDDEDCCGPQPCGTAGEHHGRPGRDAKGAGPQDKGPMVEGHGEGGEHHGHFGEHHGHPGEAGAIEGELPPGHPPIPGMGRGFGPPPPLAGWFGGARPTALLQMQGAMYTGKDNQLSAGDRAEKPGFGLRTARLGVEGQVSPRIRLAVETDLANIGSSNPASSALTNAYAAIRAWHGSEIILGAQKMPFSRFAMLHAGDQAMAEKPFATNAMAPFYQVGATVTGHYPQLGHLRWFVGGYNAFERLDNFYLGIPQNSGLGGNRFGGASMVARVQAEPLGSIGPSVADYGHSKFRFEVGAGGYFNDSGTNKSWAGSADLQLKSHGFHLLAEFLMDSATPVDQPTTPGALPTAKKRQAVIAEAGYAWHALNAAVRYEKIDPDKNVVDNQDQQIISGAVGWAVMRNRVRLNLQFDHRQESLQPVSNDTLFAQFQFRL